MEYYVNPEQFKVYKNGVFAIGNFQVIMKNNFYNLFYNYTNEIYSTSANPFIMDQKQYFPFLDTIEKVLFKLESISLTPFTGLQIKMDDRYIHIGDYVIKLAYVFDTDPKHGLYKDKVLIKESSNLYDLTVDL